MSDTSDAAVPSGQGASSQPVESASVPGESAGRSTIYTSEGLDRQIRQGEIITQVAQYAYDPTTGDVSELYHDFVVVASQDCDLERDYDALNETPRVLNEVILFEAQPYTTAPTKGHKMKDIANNNVERFAFLESCAASCDLKNEGLPALVIDFRRYFSVSSSELYRQFRLRHNTFRRTRMVAPYSDHFQARLAFYLSRIPLPAGHQRPKEADIGCVPTDTSTLSHQPRTSRQP